jgi:hypothetical protein
MDRIQGLPMQPAERMQGGENNFAINRPPVHPNAARMT